MSDVVSYGMLKRLSWLPNRDAAENGTVIAGQEYDDVEIIGGSLSNVTLTDVTINGTTTARTETIVTASGDYTVQLDDYVITINKDTPEITSVILPGAPAQSRSIIVKDGAGNAASYAITIDGNGNTIDAASSTVLEVDYAAREFIFNGTEWNVIGAYLEPNNGDVFGPSSSTDNTIPRFDGATGKQLQDSGITIDDSNNIFGAGSVSATSYTGAGTGLTGTATSLTAGHVTNATLMTALTVDTGTVTIHGDVANTSALTLGAGVSSISGSNTGDQTITLTGAVTGSGTGGFATTIATPGTLTVASTNSTATAHTHAITSSSAPGAAASLLATDASGIIGSTGTRIVKGWFIDLTVTNAISGSVTGNAGTATSAAKWTTARNLAGNSVDGSANVAFANKFIAQGTTDSGLSGAQFLGSLGTGLVKNTTTTGVLSIASVGTDYIAPGGALGTPSSGTATNITGLPPATGIIGTLTSYTPTVASSTGTITTSSASGAWVKRDTNVCWFTATANITTNGTGAGNLRIGLPFSNTTSQTIVAGIESAVSGKMVVGNIFSTNAYAQCTFYDGTYPGANSANITITGEFRYA